MNEFELQHLPEAYRPLSPWSYFGLLSGKTNWIGAQEIIP